MPTDPTTQLTEAIATALRYGVCHEEITRGGIAGPCDKPAVALCRDPDDGHPYPVCAYHARGVTVPLADVIAAAQEAAGCLGRFTTWRYDITAVWQSRRCTPASRVPLRWG